MKSDKINFKEMKKKQDKNLISVSHFHGYMYLPVFTDMIFYFPMSYLFC